MDFGKAFTFVFEDDEWITKLLIGGIINLVPVIGLIVVVGWMLEIGRRVASGGSEVLPDWSDFGIYLVRGLKAFVVVIVYALPVIILLPFAMLAGGNSQGVSSVIGMGSLLVRCVAFIYVIFLAFVLPAALMRFTMNDDSIGAGLAFGEVFSMVLGNLGTYFFAALVYFIAMFIAELGVTACVVGIIFTSPYAYAVMGHFYGQAYAVATGGSLPVNTPPAPPAAPADWTG